MSSINSTIINTLLDTYGALFNSGTLKIYAGAVPADANTAQVSPTLLGTLTFGSTAFATAAGRSITANPITQDTAADATGTASYYRAFKSDATTVIEQGTCGVTGSGADLIMNTTSVVVGGPIVATSFVKNQ
jgi:hypothetical protein